MIILDKEENKIKFYHKKNIEIIQGNSSHSFPMHSHNSFCIGIITAGKIRFRLKTCEYVLEKNHVYFVPPFTEHTILSLDNKPYSYLVICIPNEFKSEESIISFHNHVFLDKRVGEELLEKCRSFDSSHDYSQLNIDMVRFIKANTNVGNGFKKQRNIEFILQLVSYIKENLNEPFSLPKLCNYAHITKFHLLRIFKQQMGVAPYQFYIQERVRKIKQGLLEEQPAVNLVYDLNFTDQSHLCNTFKKHVGLTPKQFQKSYEEE